MSIGLSIGPVGLNPARAFFKTGRCRLVLLTWLLLFCNPLVHALQEQRRVSISGTNISIQKVFQTIKKRTGLTVFYSNELLNDKERVSLDFKEEELNQVLDYVLKGRNITYEIRRDKVIVLSRTKEKETSNLVLPEVIKPAADLVVGGRVTDNKGEGLPGVSILIKGTQRGMTSDANGKFSIEVPNEASILVFSFVGYLSQEVTVGKKSSFDVTLLTDEKALNEVVVVGFGTQQKVNLTGAVSVVKGDRLVNKAVSGTVDALQGVMPGVVVTKSSGSPGQENYNIQIRGVTSATNNPVLVLIDGTEGDIQDVRPEDVESISVLKDAASAAIYGAKAAGGVILITTKAGKAGKVKVEINSYFTAAKLGRTQDRISSYQAALMRNEAEVNAGASAPLTPAHLALLKDPNVLYDTDPTNPNTYRYWGDYDYEKLVLRAYTPMMSNNVAISGGTDKTTFRVSGTYFKNNGSLKIGPDDNTKYAGRLNLNTKINDYLELSNVLAYSNNQITKPWQAMDGDYGLWAYIFTYPGVTPLYDPHGHQAQGVRIGSFDGRIKFYQYNSERGFKSWSENNLRANSVLTIKNLVKNLQFRIVGGIDGNFDEKFFHSKITEYYGVDESVLSNLTGTNITKAHATSTVKEFQFLADYNLQIKNHGVSLFGGYSVQDYRYNYFDGYIQDLINENLPSFDWASKLNQTLTDDATTSRFQSFFGRVKYNFHNRYLFETNLRYDGSSKLNPNDRYRLFPSASAGWRVSEENWFHVKPINEFKIRGSFGQLGNSNAIGNYDYIPLLNVNSALLLGSSGGVEQKAQYINQSQLASRNITWETVESSNIGMEISLFNSRLSFEGDYYVKKNKNMLAAVAFPSVLGVGIGNQNVGQLRTRGWDASLGWRDTKGAFSYYVNANVDDSQNKLIEYLGATVIAAGTRPLLVGYPVNSIFGYKTEGLFQSANEVTEHATQSSLTGPGDVKYVDLNGDGKITAGTQTEANHGDLVYLGNNSPRYNFGLTGGLNWKGIDFSMFLQGVGKRSFLLDEQLIAPYSSAEFGPQKHNLDYWTPDNRDAFWPRLMVKGTHNFLPSDKWVQDAAYIRLKDLQVGYTIPNRLISRAGITKLRIYIAGRDIWESTKTLAFIDPEVPNQSSYQYPFRRSYTVGVNLNF